MYGKNRFIQQLNGNTICQVVMMGYGNYLGMFIDCLGKVFQLSWCGD